MPVVTLRYSRLLQLVSGPGVTREAIAERLPYLGLDIESDDGDEVRVEYSPNRPDYSTDIGIALGLQGLLGVRTGPVPLKIGDGTGLYSIRAVARAISGIRPVISGIVARGRRLDEETLRQLVAMQEDLHFGLGRGRKKAAIGLHDLGRIGGFPLTFTTRPMDHRFVPLGGRGGEMTVREVLSGTKAGRAYAGLLRGADRAPVILDAAGGTVSLPPIINSEATAITTDTEDVLVEVTGTSRHIVEHVLSVVAVTLGAAGFSLESVGITGGRNSAPEFAACTHTLTVGDVRERLGLHMTPEEVAGCLERARLEPLGAAADAITCRIPPYRQDIIDPVDLVEEVALGYGTWRIRPVLSPPGTFGSAAPASSVMKRVDMAMVGLGYLEALNSSLSSMRVLYEMAGRRPSRRNPPISTASSKSSEHTVLRDSLLPQLVENLSRNVHEPYPQRLYESGIVFLRGARPDGPASERTHLAGVSAHTDSDFAEAKSALQSVLGVEFGASMRTAAAAPRHHIFEDGRCARVYVRHPPSPTRRSGGSGSGSGGSGSGGSGRRGGGGSSPVGHIGQIRRAITAAYRIRVPVAGFELSLSDSLLSDARQYG